MKTVLFLGLVVVLGTIVVAKIVSALLKVLFGSARIVDDELRRRNLDK